MGIGHTLLEKERQRVLASKLEAWNRSLAEKREKESEERAAVSVHNRHANTSLPHVNAHIFRLYTFINLNIFTLSQLVAEEEARVMAEAHNKQMQKAKQKMADEEARRQQVERENEIWDSKNAAMGELSQSRELKQLMFKEVSGS